MSSSYQVVLVKRHVIYVGTVSLDTRTGRVLHIGEGTVKPNNLKSLYRPLQATHWRKMPVTLS